MSARIKNVQAHVDRLCIPEPNSGCFIWLGRLSPTGYGLVSRLVGYEDTLAHRLSYVLTRGAIPENKQIDHLCRNRLCVNPEHLEAVSQRTNILRGVGPTSINSKKTHCEHGHEFTSENTIVKRSGTRNCRQCCYSANKKWNARNKAHLSKYRRQHYLTTGK